MRKASNKYLVLLIYPALALTTLAAYWQVHNCDFTSYDDNLYVTQNWHVKTGLTRDNVLWAFTAGHASNWHPLTWLSHMLDCHLFGTNPRWHHLTNLLLHIANTLLLFAVLKRMTAAFWRSAFVAAVFALHPLHVESVAWIAERKDVLSTLFWLLTMIAYLNYVRRPGISRYLLALLLFALGLMAKPMLVTLPFVLLLLDYWPLERLQLRRDTNRRLWFQLVREKVPFFILSAISSVITFVVQQKSGAMAKLDAIPLMVRFGNAFISYVRYIGRMFWPDRLTIFYPHPSHELPIWQTAATAGLLLAVSVLVIRLAPKHKYLLVGWLWYLGTLFPVIGLVQVGNQASADRYTYIPLIGLFIVISWALPNLSAKWKHKKITLGASMLVALSVLFVCSRRQVSLWRNSITLFEHGLRVTKDNYMAHFCIAEPLYQQGRPGEAVAHLTEALRIKPDFPDAHSNLGYFLMHQGKLDEAIAHFTEALRTRPDFANAHHNFGYALTRQGRLEEAAAHFTEALNIKPDFPEVHNDLAVILVRQGKLDDALNQYRQALRIRPDYPQPMNAIAHILINHPNPKKRNTTNAIQLAERAAKLTRYQNPVILDTLAAAYAAQGRFDHAITTAQTALDLCADQKNDELANQIRNRLELYRQAKPPPPAAKPNPSITRTSF